MWFMYPKQNSQSSQCSSCNSILAFLTMPSIFQTVEMASLYNQPSVLMIFCGFQRHKRTNVTTRSQTRKSPSNTDESIQAAPQIEYSHQDLSIENPESMEI